MLIAKQNIIIIEINQSLYMQKHKKITFSFVILNFVSLITLVYFIYHSFIGNRGYFEMLRLEDEIEKHKAMLHKSKSEREYLNNRVSLLYDKSLNKDLLDEVARDYFGLIAPNELCIMLDDQK
ncbi:Septum formation initiator [Candidatus Bandiella woodruffii]|uniref:Septum formation initiator n=2 Tax=Candidatus Bandiella euplotis TaxID=1664265 RepID=A0ABZ0UKQ6_9RICK|nr:Septum formation initiator [Candidatus Bandiella woodruffii]